MYLLKKNVKLHVHMYMHEYHENTCTCTCNACMLMKCVNSILSFNPAPIRQCSRCTKCSGRLGEEERGIPKTV